MDAVNQTLYIPLYGKAWVSRQGILLKDPKAEEIWEKEGFPLKRKSRSRWLAYYMAMRAAVFDSWTDKQMAHHPGATVVHIGCGMDSRVLRVGNNRHLWFDLDFPDVIAERRKYYVEKDTYKMLGCDVTDLQWLNQLPGGMGIIVMEGVSMYIPREELSKLLTGICGHFSQCNILMDCYSVFAAKASRFKNPINDVGVTQVYGLDDPKALQQEGICFIGEWELTPEKLIDELAGVDRMIFRKLYAGSAAKKMYRLYEFEGTAQGR